MWNLPVVANQRKIGEVGTMKAIRFDHHGEPVKVLAIEERPVPEHVRIAAELLKRTYVRICDTEISKKAANGPAIVSNSFGIERGAE
jgi:hypothetical protein